MRPSTPNTPTPVVNFTRRYRFSASHRLNAPSLTAEQNRAAFGKCNNPHGHGHNYYVEVCVRGPVDHVTGFVVDLPKLDALAQRELLDRFDEQHVNADPLFATDFVPSTENLLTEVERVFREAVPALDPTGRLRLLNLRIEETGNNAFDMRADEPAPAHATASSEGGA